MTTGDLIAVTGATGFLGSHICDVLVEQGRRVRAAHRTSSNLRWLKGKDLETRQVDLADPASLDAFLAGCDGVIHCAGALIADEPTYQRVNVDNTRRLAEAAARNDSVQRLVFISSLAAGGPASLEHPRDESMADAPISSYGRSKLAAEAVLEPDAWPFTTVSLRPPSLYGPRDREFGLLLRAAKRGWTGHVGRRMQGLSLVHGRDAATAAVALLETASATGHYYVDDGPGRDGPRDPGRQWPWGYDWRELRQVLTTLFDRQLFDVMIPLGLLRVVSRFVPHHDTSPLLNRDRMADLDTDGWVCTAGRLQRDTGWTPAWNLASGLRDTLTFYRRMGWLR